MPAILQPVLNQGSLPWGVQRLGEYFGRKDGPSIRAKGCLLTCYAQAVRDFGIDATCTPTSILKATLPSSRPRIWYAEQPVQTHLAAALGLVAHAVALRAHIGDNLVASRIGKALLADRMVLLRVGYNQAERGQHFVLARELAPNAAICADPATGGECRIDLGTLEGQGPGKTRYHVVSIRELSLT